jgi:cephalosporin hydroxylase
MPAESGCSSPLTVSSVHAFRDLYWHSDAWRWTFWQRVPTLKCPLDLWIYQELIAHLRPQLVVELGTWAGGTALFVAQMMELAGADNSNKVITVDVLDDAALAQYASGYEGAPFPARLRPRHERIEYVHGSSLDDAVVAHVHEEANGRDPVLVIADSEHTFEHTYAELLAYHDLVTPGSWFVMEDTNGPGPRAAVERFLAEHPEFQADEQCEKFLMTFNPGGYLRRVG